MSNTVLPVYSERKIVIGSSEEDTRLYQTNYIRTTKYTALSFLPLALLGQFKRYANIYFLVSAILQSIPAISPLHPISAIAPLVFVISLSIIREGYEDLKRYRSDIETNSTKTKRYNHRDRVWEVVEWKDLKVGEVIRVESEEYFPADAIILSSSDKNGNCFIMTSSLDGEKNLKPKYAIKEIQDDITNNEQFTFMATLRYGPPNEDLYDFNGELQKDKTFGIGAKQLLLREAQLKNTEYVLCAVVYTGKDTKIMMNANEPRFKMSNIENITNKLILLLIGVQLVMCLVVFIGSSVWNSLKAEDYEYYIPIRYKPIGEAFLVIFTVFVLLNTIIPISLIISLEMVKWIQAYFIDNDVDMVNKEGRHSKTYNSTLNEELGQIEYVFSDKTGTLTCNVMEFKACVLGGKIFGDVRILDDQTDEQYKRRPTYVDKRQGIEYGFEDQELSALVSKDTQGDKVKFTFKDSNNREVYRIENEAELVENFMLTLSMCHDCLLDADPTKETKQSYQGPSPDEVALVDSASHLGYSFIKTTNTGKIVRINGIEQEIEVLQFFEFDSNRKRSSIIIKHNGLIKLLVKGADSIIIDRLSDKVDQPYLEKTKELLERFSVKGFRTLCFAMKVITQREYDEIVEEMNKLNTDPEKPKKIKAVASNIETDLVLLGCTSVEDKLQDDVPKVIANMIDANIKVWMLTGDKLETAENIGFSCRLIQDDFKRLYLKAPKKVNEDVKQAEDTFLQEKYNEILEELREKPKNMKVCLIVEGPVILNLKKYAELAKAFIENIFTKCDSVICCRMSPKQKGDIVRFVKKYQNKITLAIGDGANDVNMIQEAHIGIGLYGKEGMRAVQASDYALVEFKGLWKLLFVHGRWSYMRIGEMIKYFYYKNIIFAIPQFIYCFYNAYSAQTIYDDFYITFYNLAFTSWPVIIRAIFDQDIYYKTLDQRIIQLKDLKTYYHYLYYVGQRNLVFS